MKAAGVQGATVRAAGKRTLQISKLTSKGSRKVTVTLRRGAVRLSGKLRKQARKGKRPRRCASRCASRDTKGVQPRVAGDRDS